MTLPLRISRSFEGKDLVARLQGELFGELNQDIEGVCLDSRSLEKGDAFFALRAARDGHEFVENAVKGGASLAVVEKDLGISSPSIRVSDTLKSLQGLASSIRQEWSGKLIGITGSNGKTTTKEMIAALLESKFDVLKAPGTWNNHLGIPLTLLQLKKEHSAAVLEMGINDFGEMENLCSIAKPNIGVITNIGPVHLEKLESEEGVLRAKSALLRNLGKSDWAIVNVDDERLCALQNDLSAQVIQVSAEGAEADVSIQRSETEGFEGTTLDLKYGGAALELRIPFLGEHNASNFAMALGVALACEVPKEALQEHANRIEKPQMRLEVHDGQNGLRIVRDCYNANPGSTLAALRTVSDLQLPKTWAVLGDMMELGSNSPRLHRDIGKYVPKLGFERLYCLGQYAGDLAQGAIQEGMNESQVSVHRKMEDLIKDVETSLEKDLTILVKGSRGMKMERFCDAILEKNLGGKS